MAATEIDKKKTYTKTLNNTKNSRKQTIKDGKGHILREMLKEKNITTRDIVARIATSEKYRHTKITEYRMNKILEDNGRMEDEEMIMIIDLGRLDPAEVFKRLEDYTIRSITEGYYAARMKSRTRNTEEESD